MEVIRVLFRSVILALIGLLGSLFIRPRRVWVRLRRTEIDGVEQDIVEVAVLDSSSAGESGDEIVEIVAHLRGSAEPATSWPEEGEDRQDGRASSRDRGCQYV